ncbi:MAG: hypothetical protein GAK29_02189 [Acinetobacter bereziniae]|uniref:Uncharacterized protein n=1 Tax=Acinetobacter bereziniae TaxID=106648 RepID=A0A833PCC2_ACIBZ|nr:MAG: hypothetical protein GAK29_02189 [Acinetobacter bereziniae]
MKKIYNTPFSEFLKKDETGRYHIRLGPQIFSTNRNLTDIRIEYPTGAFQVTPAYLTAKPWVKRELKKMVAVERSKEKEQMFNKSCFHRTPYSPEQRTAYKNARYNA